MATFSTIQKHDYSSLYTLIKRMTTNNEDFPTDVGAQLARIVDMPSLLEYMRKPKLPRLTTLDAVMTLLLDFFSYVTIILEYAELLCEAARLKLVGTFETLINEGTGPAVLPDRMLDIVSMKPDQSSVRIFEIYTREQRGIQGPSGPKNIPYILGLIELGVTQDRIARGTDTPLDMLILAIKAGKDMERVVDAMLYSGVCIKTSEDKEEAIRVAEQVKNEYARAALMGM